MKTFTSESEPEYTHYRKKPLVVQACRIDEPFQVETLEGTMLGKKGDYLIRGVANEVYPCRADIFEQTYELLKGKSIIVSKQFLEIVTENLKLEEKLRKLRLAIQTQLGLSDQEWEQT